MCRFFFCQRERRSVFSPPENDSFRKDFCFAVVFSFFFLFSPRNLRAPWADRREILHDVSQYVQFYNPGPKFWGSLPKKILHAKFGPISVDFEVWRRISPERMKIFKIGELLV